MSIFKKNKKKENVSQDEMMNVKRAAIEAALKKMRLMYTLKGLGGEICMFELGFQTKRIHCINFHILLKQNGMMFFYNRWNSQSGRFCEPKTAGRIKCDK